MIEENSQEEIELIDRLESNITNKKGLLGATAYKHLLEEYITTLMKNVMKDQYPSYNFYRLTIDEISNLRNYVDIRISILFYHDEEYYKVGNYSTSITVELRELFCNCSTIVINKLYGELLNKSLCNTYMSILEKICSLTGYSCILYTASDRETKNCVLDYLTNNWKLIKEFKNKRTSSIIKYYTKDL